MKMKTLVIGDIQVPIPIIQGGMGVGISRYKLASAVAREGGIGLISAAQIGYDEEGFKENPIQTNLRAIDKHIKLAKAKADGGIIGINIMVATKDYDKYVQASCKAGADIIVSGAGLPLNLPKLVQGYKTKIAPIVSSKKATSVILKYWDRKHGRMPDLIVAEGPKAGGHLGFSQEQLLDANYDFNLEFVEILQVVKEYEEKYQMKIPLIFAGGIFDRKDIDEVLSLGADGVQIGTRFVTTEECDASMEYKQAYINAQKQDISLILSPVGMPGRALKNSFVKQVEIEKVPIEQCFNCLERCDRKNIPYCISKALINAVNGDINNGLIFAGSKVHKSLKIESVKQVFQELTQES